MDRLVFLVDMNAFFISCETVRRPELREVPAAVAGDPKRRTGIVLAANYAARGFGVRTAMSVYQALNLCPELVLVAPDHRYYSQKSNEVMDLLGRFSPVVEQNSIDEAWLDMTGSHKLFGAPLEAAFAIQSAIETELGLWCSIGVSNNKFLAKMAAEMKKPQGITTLFPAELEKKLWPLPVGKVYGIGAKTAQKFNDLGMFTISDLAHADPNWLQSKFGKSGPQLHRCVNGLEVSPVTAHQRDDVKSIGKSVTLSEDLRDLSLGKQILFSLSDQVGRSARKKNRAGTTIQITIKYSDFQTITRQQTVAPTHSSRDIYKTASKLLEDHWKSSRSVRLLGVTLGGFDKDVPLQQLSMFDEGTPLDASDVKQEELEKTMDLIREKFGSKSLVHAILLKKTDSESS